MSEKITRISENIRTHDENGYIKGDLSYARNRTIGAGTETEDEYDAAEMARRKQMYGNKGRAVTGGEFDSGDTTVNKGIVASSGKHVTYTGKNHLNPSAAEDNTALNSSNDGNGGIDGTVVGTGAGMSNHSVSSGSRLRQAYRQIASQNKTYNRTSEVLTNARRKITRASLNSVKKSGETAANVLTLGRYKAVKESRDGHWSE